MSFQKTILLLFSIHISKSTSTEQSADQRTPFKCQSNSNSNNHSSVDAECITQILTNMLQDYDRGMRPGPYDQPITITIGIWILSIDAINVVDMDYRIDLFFRQEWTDKRLSHTHHSPLTVDNSMLDDIWIPDTYFPNSKTSYFHSVTVPNKMLRISPQGSVEYSARISLKASCPMNLLDFPMDSQICMLQIESYSHDIDNIVYRWEKGERRVAIGNNAKQLPQYNLTNFSTTKSSTGYGAKEWSALQFRFSLRRRAAFFALHFYAPCVLVVMLSWIAFFIPRDSHAARISLGITSVLTTTTIMNIQNNSMPKVSYIKLADWYLIVCFLFVFSTLLEFTLTLYLSTAQHRILKEQEAKRAARCRRVEERSAFGCNDYTKYLCDDGTESGFLVERIKREHEVVEEDDPNEPLPWLARVNLDMIDGYSRILFPLSFLLFNVGYWLYFIDIKNNTHYHV